MRRNNNWNNNWPSRDRKRSADFGNSTSASNSKRQSRHSRVPDPPAASTGRQVVPRPLRPVVPQERVPLRPSRALCGLYVQFLEQNPESDMTPDQFKNLELGRVALSGFNSQASAGGFDVEPSIPPQKKKNRMHGLYVWKNVTLHPSEPCIFFHKNLQILYLRKAVVMSLPCQMPRNLREEWNKKTLLFYESIVSYFSSVQDEKTFAYESSIDLNFIKTRFEFPLDDYDLWFRPNMDSLVLFMKDFVRCRRLGIPVLKLEPTTYYRFAKYLWYPHVLPLSKGRRIPMDKGMQLERMDFILCNNIVYIEQDSDFRNNWKKWSEYTITFCQEYVDYYWGDSLRHEPPHKPAVEKKFLKTDFPYDIFMKVEERKDMDLFQHLCDFIYCLHHGIEKEKCPTFCFEGEDYLVNPQLQTNVKFTSEVPSVGVNNKVTPTEYTMTINGCAFNGMNALKTETDKYLSRFMNSYDCIGNAEYIQRYQNIVHLHAAFDLNVLPHQVVMAIKDYTQFMNLVYKNSIYESIHNEPISESSLTAKKQEGIRIIRMLHKHNGFALGFLENMLCDDNKKQDFLAAERDGTRHQECVYCPLNSLALTAIGLRPESEDRFDSTVEHCDTNVCMTENQLLTHLVDEAYLNGCHRHCAALMYVKNVLLLGKNRSTMLHHIGEQTYNHVLLHENVMKQRSDDSTGLHSDEATVQSGNTVHEEEEMSCEEGQTEEIEEVSVQKKENKMLEALDEMKADDDNNSN